MERVCVPMAAEGLPTSQLRCLLHEMKASFLAILVPPILSQAHPVLTGMRSPPLSLVCFRDLCLYLCCSPKAFSSREKVPFVSAFSSRVVNSRRRSPRELRLFRAGAGTHGSLHKETLAGR